MTSSRPLPRPSFALLTLGCKSNQYDSAALGEELRRVGLLEGGPEEAGLVVVNGCAVTREAEAQGRQAVRRIRRVNPDAVLVLTGCLVAASPGAAGALAGVDLVLPPAARGQLLSRLGFPGKGWCDWPPDPAVGAPERGRALLKVEDGCAERCAYCLVPSLRGEVRSLPPEKVARAVQDLLGRGFGEVVLTGIHLGAYGRDLLPPRTLEELLLILVSTGLPGRLRLSSLEAGEVTSRLVGIMASAGDAIAPHLHIPLQSGSDRVLAAMGRPGRAEGFIGAVMRAREGIPRVGLGCDLITGFPGEREEDFEASRSLIDRLAIPFVHAFPFSPRPGTPAASLPDDVPPEVKRGRVKTLQETARGHRLAFLDTLVGRNLAVVVEGKLDPKGRAHALAGNYARVLVEGGGRAGSLVRVRVRRRSGENLVASAAEAAA